MTTKSSSIILVVISTFLTASGQFFFKRGAEMLPSNLLDIPALVVNWPLILGLGFYGLALIMLVLALQGGELSVLYPFISLGFVWVALVSIFILKEPFTIPKAAGMAFILGGVSLIGFGAKRGQKK